jgi:hypothetical protein
MCRLVVILEHYWIWTIALVEIEGAQCLHFIAKALIAAKQKLGKTQYGDDLPTKS